MTTTTDPRVHRIRLAEFGIPPQWRTVRQDKQTSREARDFVEDLRDHLVTSKRPLEEYPEDRSDIGRGLLWAGLPGRGKTHEAVATLIECYYRWNIRVFFVPYAEYIGWQKESWNISKEDFRDRWVWLQSNIGAVREAPVLLIDDVGKERDGARSRYAAGELDTLLRLRYNSGLPTLVTTNVPPAEWGNVYNESMGSFIKEAFTAIPMTGKDRRR